MRIYLCSTQYFSSQSCVEYRLHMMANFDLQFDFDFDSDDEANMASNSKKRQLDTDAETPALPKRRKLSMNSVNRNRKKVQVLSETAKQFYSLESGESSESEAEETITSKATIKRKMSKALKRRKLSRKLELEAKARLFHSIIGQVR